MSKTNFRHAAKLAALAGAVAMGFLSLGSSAQTIAEVAERQRAKLQAEANPSPQPATTVAPQPRVKVPPVTPWKLYGIHSVGQKMGAEVLYAGQLIKVQKGSVLGQYRVVDVTLSSLKLETDRGCGRKCPASKVVPLGGAF